MAQLNKENVDEALKLFQICDQICSKEKEIVDDNLLAVLKYNYACCFNRFGMVDESISALKEAIVILRRKLD